MKYRLAAVLIGIVMLGSGCSDPECQPMCTGRVCGDDGCGGSCGVCGNGIHCVEGKCGMPRCVPSCRTRECGDDGCGGSCGACPTGKTCQNTYGLCVSLCEPECSGKQCGDDGCGSSCGACPTGFICKDYSCADPGSCTPDCTQKQCGDDGCGGTCGSCSNSLVCNNGICESCKPACIDRECGSDGCGGTCGECKGNSLCNDSTGQCVPYRVTGRIILETQTIYYDTTTTPSLNKKLDISGRKLPLSLRDKSGKELAQTTTEADGTFNIPISRLPADTDWISIVPVWYVANKPKVTVLKAQDDDTNTMWEWTIKLSNYMSEDDPGNLGNIRITTNLSSGALYIFQLIVRAYEDLVRYGFSTDLSKLPSMAVVWTPGHVWNCGTCYVKESYSLGNMNFDTMMFVGGSATDESAWGYPTILHEFGHYVLFQKRDNSAGGTHYLTGISEPTLAWSEGWATFFSLQMMSFRTNAPVSQFWRVLQSGSYWIDFAHLYEGALSGNIAIPQPYLENGMFQNIGEGWITYMLWDFWDGSDFKDPSIPEDGIAFSAKEIFAALSSNRYLTPQSYDKENRCPSNEPEKTICKNSVHFMHFVDALLCNADPEVVQKVSDLLIERQYPYDRSPVCEVK